MDNTSQIGGYSQSGRTSLILSEGTSLQSLPRNKIAASGDGRILDANSTIPAFETADQRVTVNNIPQWMKSVSQGDFANDTDQNCMPSFVTAGSSFNSLITSPHHETGGCLLNESAIPASAYNTLSSIDENNFPSQTFVCPTNTISDHTEVARSSGGYASLSTNSGTDSTDTCDRKPNKTMGQGNSSTDSCASSLNSSSVVSLSMLCSSNRQPDLSSQQDLTENEDNRATLVPTGIPDPVARYEEYCMQDGIPTVCDQIRRDIDRQFPFHQLFCEKGGHGQESLYTLLKAYTIRHPKKGYCQGQAPLAAVLLMFMPEVDAFWTFNEICERYLEAYYDDGLERVQIDGEILYVFLKNIYPPIYKFLRKFNVDPILIMLEWFMCVFSRTLPWSAVLRILDMFFCEGKVVLFRVAIVLLHRMFGTQTQRKSCFGIEDILTQLHDVASYANNLNEFIREVVRIPISPKDIALEAIRQSHKWHEKKQKQVSP